MFNLFPAPLLRASFVRTRGRPWQLQRIRPIPYGEIPESHYGSLLDSMEAHFGRRQRARPRFATGYDLAILVDKEEKDPPSNAGALRHFAAAAKDVGFSVETLTKEDYGRIAEFDALFIRATTRANHYTYRFARRAAVEGLVVIDDPDSIIRCTNKVYLAELMQRRRIPTPPTFLVHRDNREQVGKSLGYPVVLKRPDSAFSAGVEKADDPASLETAVKKFLETSDLVVAQAFLPTQFDWRVGTLGGQPLFVCRYYMAGGHWQIYHHGAKRTISGDADTLPVEEAPEAVVQVALKAANAIGAGLYGVDVKERDGKYYVIEVNDNPNLDSGVEDQVLGKELYLRIMGHMMGLVRARKNGPGNG